MMKALCKVWLWLFLLGPVAATAGGVWGPDSTARGDAATAQTTANTAVSNAATAQTTANTAVANAATAQTTANTANTGLANLIAGTTAARIRALGDGTQPGGNMVGGVLEASASAVVLTTGTAVNATQVGLAQGFWMVITETYFNPAATTSITKMASSISETSATHYAAASSVWVGAAAVPGAANPKPSTGGVVRFVLVPAGMPVIYHAVCQATFTVAALTCSVQMTAVRLG